MAKRINKRILLVGFLEILCLAFLSLGLAAVLMVTIRGIKPEYFFLPAAGLAALACLALMYKNDEPSTAEFALKISIQTLLVLFSAIILILYFTDVERFKHYFWVSPVFAALLLLSIAFDVTVTKSPKWYKYTQTALICVAFLISVPMTWDYLTVTVKKESLFLGKAIGKAIEKIAGKAIGKI